MIPLIFKRPKVSDRRAEAGDKTCGGWLFSYLASDACVGGWNQCFASWYGNKGVHVRLEVRWKPFSAFKKRTDRAVDELAYLRQPRSRWTLSVCGVEVSKTKYRNED